MKIINKKKYFFIASGALLAIGLLALVFWGLDFGIDFTGGSLLEVEFKTERPALKEIREELSELKLKGLVIQPTGEQGLILRFQDIEEETHQKVLEKLRKETKEIEEKRFNAIGPTIGQELKKRTFWAIIISIVGMILYISWAFRKISWPLASWKYGSIAIFALAHDIFMVLGIFAILGRFMGIEVGVPFVAALMTILGYSVNDTIVIFDRVRENLMKAGRESFEEIVDRSVRQSFARSINTGMTTLIVLGCVLFFGGETIRDFVLALIIGIFFGTYSSIFIASPLLVVWRNWETKRK